METTKIILKNEEGIHFILNNLSKLKDKNEAYYANTLKYFTKDHPPFPESLIYYHPEDNFFRFISRVKLTNIPVRDWEDYNGNEVCLIKTNTFAYLSVEPFLIIVSNAQWLLDNMVPYDSVNYFHNYMHEKVDIERKEWKSKLTIKQTAKLF